MPAEKCSQFVFCPSHFLTLSVTFPSRCPYIPALCPLSLLQTLTLRCNCFLLTQLPSLRLAFPNLSLEFGFQIRHEARAGDDSECMVVVIEFFPTSYFVTMLSKSVTSRDMWVSGGSAKLSEKPICLERQRMALIILSPWRGMCQTGYSSFVLMPRPLQGRDRT